MKAETTAPPPVAERDQEWRPYHALALLPTIGMLGGLPFANRVYPIVFGLPFLFVWLVGWVLGTSVIMGCILMLDRAREATADRIAGVPPSTGQPERAS
jgi:hypothetical protein